MSDLARYQHPRFVKAYPRSAAQSDARGATEHRTGLLAGLAGRVIEVPRRIPHRPHVRHGPRLVHNPRRSDPYSPQQIRHARRLGS